MSASTFLRALVAAGALLVSIGGAMAQDAGAVKGRMEQRLPAIDGLKDRGVAGENNRGFLEVRGTANATEQKTISDENADRREAYGIIAAETGSDLDSVGRRRAQQIAIASKRGVWMQSASGEWRKK
jgi:hypothetical protein